ncbi:hypothetical protein T484DRAFT_1758418, partial [Baffinella frigidus]
GGGGGGSPGSLRAVHDVRGRSPSTNASTASSGAHEARVASSDVPRAKVGPARTGSAPRARVGAAPRDVHLIAVEGERARLKADSQKSARKDAAVRKQQKLIISSIVVQPAAIATTPGWSRSGGSATQLGALSQVGRSPSNPSMDSELSSVSRNATPRSAVYGGWAAPGMSIAETSGAASSKRVRTKSVVAPADPKVKAKGMWDRRHDTQYTGLLHEKGWQGPLDKKKKKSLKDAAVEE